MSKYIAYYRVSTQKQGRSGLGLDAQQEAVFRYLGSVAGELVGEYTEVESSKKNADRPKLGTALEQCRRDGARLVIAKLDRLARNVAFIATLMESGVDFVAADMPTANRLTIHILAAVAEHEREAISIRTKDALAAAKRRGTKLGNPNPAESLTRGRTVRDAAMTEHRDKVRPFIARLREEGLTYRAIAAELERLDVPTGRGKTWDPSTVRRTLLKKSA